MNKLKLAVAVAALSGMAQAHADINFRGFGSFVAGIGTGLEEGQTVLGYDDSIDYKRDSLLALQMDGDMGEGLSATMQLISRGANNFDPDVEWAYLTYQINDELQLSAGRIRAPFYRYSDFLDVRYAYNWVSAPARVYSFDFPGYDGLSLLYTTSFGPVDSSLQVIAGELNDLAGSTPIKFENLVGLSWVGSWEFLTGRLSVLNSKATIELNDFQTVADTYTSLSEGFSQLSLGFTGTAAQLAAVPGMGATAARFDDFDTSDNDSYAENLNQAAAAYAANVDQVLLEGDRGTYYAVGLSADYENFLADVEWITYEVEDGMVPETQAYYLTLGYRAGPTVIYTTYSREKGDAPTNLTSAMPDFSEFIPVVSAEPVLAAGPGAELLAGTLGAIQGAEMLRTSLNGAEVDIVNIHVGVRWDFHPSAALKFAYEIEDNKISDEDGGVFRTAIDFVF